MSLAQQYRNTQAAIKELQDQLQELEGNEGLQKELEFEEKLRALMGEYNKSLRDIISLLDPQSHKAGLKSTKQTTGTGATRRERKVKVYKNPHSGEVIETKGGNHKTLKQWKAEHGSDEVESWATIAD